MNEQVIEQLKKIGDALTKMSGSVKGDLPGHPFRGNQWSGGQGGMMAPDLDMGSGVVQAGNAPSGKGKDPYNGPGDWGKKREGDYSGRRTVWTDSAGNKVEARASVEYGKVGRLRDPKKTKRHLSVKFNGEESLYVKVIGEDFNKVREGREKVVAHLKTKFRIEAKETDVY